MTSYFLLITSLLFSLELVRYLRIFKNLQKFKTITKIILKIFGKKSNNLENQQLKIIKINKILIINIFFIFLKIFFIFVPQIVLSIINIEFYNFLITLKGFFVSLIFSIIYLKIRS